MRKHSYKRGESEKRHTREGRGGVYEGNGRRGAKEIAREWGGGTAGEVNVGWSTSGKRRTRREFTRGRY